MILCHDRVSSGSQYHTRKMLDRFELNYTEFPNPIKIPGKDKFVSKVTSAIKLKRQVEKILELVKPRIIVMPLDNDPISQILIAISHKHGIKTVLIPEGIIKPFDFLYKQRYLSTYLYAFLRKLGIFIKYIKYSTGGCDSILVSGPNAYRILCQLGHSKRKLHIVGQQKYDRFIKKIKHIKPVLQDKKSILYAASTRIFTNDDEVRFVRDLSYALANRKIPLIIKLHPRTSNSVEELRVLLEIQSSEYLSVIKEGYDTYDLLLKVYGVATIASAIVLEALMLDKECIVANYIAGRRRFDYDQYDALFSINQDAELDRVVGMCIERKKPWANKKRLLEDEIFSLDGNSALRTAMFIEARLSS
jgi:hypothetical protein